MYFLDVKITSFNCEVGLLVARGMDWKWGRQDFSPITGKQANGTVRKCLPNMEAWVHWADGGIKRYYRIGAENAFDLVLVSGTFLNPINLKQYEV